MVRDALRAEGISIRPEALEDAVSRLGSDRGVTRREIEKLALYMHGQKQVSLEDVRAIMGDEAEARSEQACDAAGNGDLAGLDLKGKVAVIMAGSPAEIPGALSSHYQSAGERWKTFKKAGAVGFITILNPASMDIPWSH